MKTPIFATVFLVSVSIAATAPVYAEDGGCKERVSEVKEQWQASPLAMSRAKAAAGSFKQSHYHPAMVANYMYSLLDDAEELCANGKDHEALLNVDVIRAWLKLPFEEHPASHDYHPEKK